jgi:hypothetical protein
MRAGAGADSAGRCRLRRASSPSSSVRPWQILGSSVGETSPPWRRLCSSLAAPWPDGSLMLRGRSCSTVARARPGARRLADSHARPPGDRWWRRSSRSR